MVRGVGNDLLEVGGKEEILPCCESIVHSRACKMSIISEGAQRHSISNLESPSPFPSPDPAERCDAFFDLACCGRCMPHSSILLGTAASDRLLIVSVHVPSWSRPEPCECTGTGELAKTYRRSTHKLVGSKGILATEFSGFMRWHTAKLRSPVLRDRVTSSCAWRGPGSEAQEAPKHRITLDVTRHVSLRLECMNGGEASSMADGGILFLC